MWKRLNGEPIRKNIGDSVREAILYEKSLGHRLKLCIGSDSQVKNGSISFATAIVFLREGKGGFMYVNHELVFQPMSLKERMIAEVAKSINIAYELCPILEANDVSLEVHADINTDPSFKSNVALKEAMGYIMGMGYTFKAKPDAFASSSCADKAT
jgi:uncharacterized protein